MEFQKTFNDHICYVSNRAFTAEQVAIIAIRQLFTGIQQGKGEYRGAIRLRRALVDCTPEGFIYEYSNKGRKVNLILGTYDAIVQTNDEDCVAYQQSLYFSV